MASEYVSSSRFVHKDLTFELEDSSLYHVEERTDGQTSTHTLKWTVPNYCTQLLNKVSYVCHQIRIGKRYHRLRILKYDTRIQVGGVSQPEKLIYLLVGVTPALSDTNKASFALLAGRDCEVLPVNGLKNVLRHLPYRDCFVEFMDTQSYAGMNDKPHLGILCRFTVPVTMSVDLLNHERIMLYLEKLLQDTETSDVTFIIGDQEFKAHRIILIARSSVFRAMFRHHTLISDHCISHQGHHENASSAEETISCDNHCAYHQGCTYEVITGGSTSNNSLDSRRHPVLITGTEEKSYTNHQDSRDQNETDITDTAETLSDRHQQTTQNIVSSDINHKHVSTNHEPINDSFCSDVFNPRPEILDIDSTRSQVFHQPSHPNIEVTKADTRSHISRDPSNRTTCTNSCVTRCPASHQPNNQDITNTAVSHQPNNQNSDITRSPVLHQPSQQNTTRCPVCLQPDKTRSHNYQANRTVTIVDTDAEAFTAFLNYLYTDRLRSLSPGLAQDLLTLADKYDIQDLKEEVSGFLLSNLSTDCVLRTLVLADRHGDVKLKDQAVIYVASNLKQVMKRQEWTDFMTHFDLLNDVLRQIVVLLDRLKNV